MSTFKRILTHVLDIFWQSKVKKVNRVNGVRTKGVTKITEILKHCCAKEEPATMKCFIHASAMVCTHSDKQ